MMQIIHSDYYLALSQLEEGCADLILTDPPYGATNATWDTPVSLPQMWTAIDRILKPNGACLIFAQTPFDKLLGMSNIKNLRYEWIWEKVSATGHFNAKKMPMKAHENILVFYKKLPTYNPQKTQGHKPVNSYTKRAEVANRTSVYGKVKVDVAGGGETDRYPRDVLRFSSDKQKTKLTGLIHSAQKPVALLEYLIKTYTNEDDLVVDPFMGSGSTGVAARALGRGFVGVDSELRFVEIARKRLDL